MNKENTLKSLMCVNITGGVLPALSLTTHTLFHFQRKSHDNKIIGEPHGYPTNHVTLRRYN